MPETVTAPALVGVTIVFGAGQQAVTRFLDQRAEAIVAKAH